MARRRRRGGGWTAGELNLVAMIDVAFQLLNFFLITAHPVDVMAHLTVLRPQAEKRTQEVSPANVIRITVFPKGYTLNERIVTLQELEALMVSLSSLDKNQSILIQCTNAARHSKLVDLLDMCAKLRLTNLSVISSNAF